MNMQDPSSVVDTTARVLSDYTTIGNVPYVRTSARTRTYAYVSFYIFLFHTLLFCTCHAILTLTSISFYSALSEVAWSVMSHVLLRTCTYHVQSCPTNNANNINPMSTVTVSTV